MAKPKSGMNGRIGFVLKQYRWATRGTLRQLGTEIGISAATLMRAEQGRVIDDPTLMRILFWLFGVPAPEVGRGRRRQERADG